MARARVRAHQRKDGSRVRAHDRLTPQSGDRRSVDPDTAASAAAVPGADVGSRFGSGAKIADLWINSAAQDLAEMQSGAERPKRISG